MPLEIKKSRIYGYYTCISSISKKIDEIYVKPKLKYKKDYFKIRRKKREYKLDI